MTRSTRITIGLTLGAGLVLAAREFGNRSPAGEWPGVDDAVIGRFVAEAGRPESRPLIDWIHGDLLLFAFLCAGLVAGFVLGFWGRALFAEVVRPADEASDVQS